jgi:hypothetical protein
MSRHLCSGSDKEKSFLTLTPVQALNPDYGSSPTQDEWTPTVLTDQVNFGFCPIY